MTRTPYEQHVMGRWPLIDAKFGQLQLTCPSPLFELLVHTRFALGIIVGAIQVQLEDQLADPS